MEKLEIGGILISSFKVSDIIAKRAHYAMYDKEREDASFERRLENEAKLFEKLEKGLSIFASF